MTIYVMVAVLKFSQVLFMGDTTKKQRPGRRVAAERRRLAREVIRGFYDSPDFAKLPNNVQVALLVICPRKDTHPQPKNEDASL